MARMEPLGINEVDDEIRHMCEESERQIGTSASTRTYARNPVVSKALAAFRGALVREGTIDPVIRELVRIKIAGLNACRYWLKARYAGARHAGATEEKIAAINDDTSDLLTPRERAAVRFAEKLAVDHNKVDDALWAEVRAQFSEAEVIELVAHTTLYIGFGRFNEIVGIDPA
jgi:AhpD family alkylhydroperoxidase